MMMRNLIRHNERKHASKSNCWTIPNLKIKKLSSYFQSKPKEIKKEKTKEIPEEKTQPKHEENEIPREKPNPKNVTKL